MHYHHFHLENTKFLTTESIKYKKLIKEIVDITKEDPQYLNLKEVLAMDQYGSTFFLFKFGKWISS